jgi:hypothetical protein
MKTMAIEFTLTAQALGVKGDANGAIVFDLGTV